MDILHDWKKKSQLHLKAYKHMLQKKSDKNKWLPLLPAFHDEAVAAVDCLQCAACCKNFSPRFKTPDIKRISRLLQLKEGAFIDQYLRIDEEGDYVLQTLPCPFLGADNRCSIYDNRPSDCRRFPYTDEDVLLKRPHLTLKNATFCPITFYVLEKMLASSR